MKATTRGRLSVRLGPMFAGKSSWLVVTYDHHVQMAYTQCEKAGAPPPELDDLRRRFCVFRPAVDTRSPEGYVVTHGGRRMVAVVARALAEVLARSCRAEAVFLDEIQFWPHAGGDGLVATVDALLEDGVDVYAVGLDYDSNGVVFETSAALAMMAQSVELYTAACAFCAAPATRTHRKPSSSSSAAPAPRILVGGAELYEPACEPCWRERFNARP